MFHHIVLLRFDADATLDQRREIVEALRALPSLIDEIVGYEVHSDVGLAPDNAHVSVHGTFIDEDAWRIYSAHPAHVEVLDGMIKPILVSAMRTQYTT